MSARSTSFVARVREVVDMLDGAFAAAVAVEGGHRPSPVSLRKLGLPRTSFDGVRLR